MKRLLFIVVFAVSLMVSSYAWGATWYADGWNGDDSFSGAESDSAFATIRVALNRCSNGDTIQLVGPFVEAPWDTTHGGTNDWDKDPRKLQISVDKSNITLLGMEIEGNLPIIYSYSPGETSDHTEYTMRIDNTGNEINNIKFDGYYDSDYVNTHDVIFSTPEADSTEISNCEFTNYGYNFGEPGHSVFYAIITGGWPDQSPINYYENYIINDNTFYDNPFEGYGSHEIYVNATKNSEIKRNTITNNGYGDPIKFRDDCSNITVDNNTVYGTKYCFVSDYPNSGEACSSDIIVTNNTFSDPNTVLGGSYRGPHYSPRYSPFISEFSGNTITEEGDRNWEVKGITTNGSSLFMAYKNTSDNHIVAFREHNGPIFTRIVYNDDYICDGNMAHITDASDTTIIVSSRNNNIIRVYKADVDDQSCSYYSDLSTSEYDITAMCSWNSTTFLTAVTEDSSGVIYARIYKSKASTLLDSLIYNSSSVNDVTAMGVSGSTLVFGTDEGGGSYKIYSGTIPLSGYISTTGRENLTDKVTGLTYKGSTLMTAVQNGTSTKIYSGITADPVGTLRETYTTTNLISLESDSEFIFMVKDDTTDSGEEKTVYFTSNTVNMDSDIIYNSKWYTENY